MTRLDWMRWCRWRVGMAKEKVVTWVAWHLPRPIVYWAAIRFHVSGTLGSEHPDDPCFSTLAKRWDAAA